MVYGLLEQSSQETNCPICLETIAPGEQVRKHHFESVLTRKGCGAGLCRLPASLWPRSLLRGLACQVCSHRCHHILPETLFLLVVHFIPDHCIP